MHKLVTKFLPSLSKSKRVVSLQPARIQLDSEGNMEPEKTSPALSLENVEQIPEQWQLMPFDGLCSLSPAVLQQLSLQVKKTKMNVNDQLFMTNKQIVEPSSELSPYWLRIYRTFCNMEPIADSLLQSLKSKAYKSQMYIADHIQDSQLHRVIQKFVNNIHEVKNLQTYAEPTFCKYLLSLKRDLKMQGLDIASHIDPRPKTVRLLGVIGYEYQFWEDVKHNRSKNGIEDKFIIQSREIDNPNSSLVILDKYPKVNVTFITRKRKRKDFIHSFIVKILVQVEVDGLKHVVKVQSRGPSNAKDENEFKNKYSVIDYDDIFKGNPTIRPLFQF